MAKTKTNTGNKEFPNKIHFGGEVVAFKSSGKVDSIMIRSTYTIDGHALSASRWFKLFNNDTTYEKGDIVDVTAHFTTRKYNDKYIEEIVIDEIATI